MCLKKKQEKNMCQEIFSKKINLLGKKQKKKLKNVKSDIKKLKKVLTPLSYQVKCRQFNLTIQQILFRKNNKPLLKKIELKKCKFLNFQATWNKIAQSQKITIN